MASLLDASLITDGSLRVWVVEAFAGAGGVTKDLGITYSQVREL